MGNIFPCVDIGTTQISIIIGYFKNSTINILFAKQIESYGVQGGFIVDVKGFKERLKMLINHIKESIYFECNFFYISINSSMLFSINAKETVTIPEYVVEQELLNALLFSIIEEISHKRVKIIHISVEKYSVDSHRGILYPLGICGNTLVCFLCIVLSPINAIFNVIRILENCNILVRGYMSTGYAASLACLNEEEMLRDNIVIELGGYSSTISIFSRGKILFTDGISIGGVNITEDIAKIFNIDFSTAENIKITYSNSNFINNMYSITSIINARIKEIVLLLKSKLNFIYTLSIYNVVITGGCSRIFNIIDIISSVMKNKYIRIVDNVYNFLKKKVSTVSFGMLKGLCSASEKKNNIGA